MKKSQIIVLIIAVLGILYFAYKIETKTVAIADEIQIEYGEKLELENSVFLVINHDTELTIDTSSVVLNEDKVPEVGRYTIKVAYKTKLFKQKAEKNVVLEVIDTIAPLFTKTVDVINLPFGTNNIDIEKYFESTDLSPVSLVLDDSGVQYKKAGKYEAVVSAQDASNNAISHSFEVIILEEPKNEVGVNKPNPTNPKVKPKYVDGILVVNKKFGLPRDYSPGENATAKKALVELIDAMQQEGLDISNSYSGFRTFQRQEELYNRYVAQDGKKRADTYSARPGHSEHQTGLTYDLLHSNGALVEKEKEVEWIRENVAKYGFIVRYPKGKDHITGFQYEPWHLRYIGDKAQEIMASGLTLEEYLKVEGGDYN